MNHIHIKYHNVQTQLWGNIYLTNEYNLYIDQVNQQHNQAAQRLGLQTQDLLITGAIHRWKGDLIINYRSEGHLFDNEQEQYRALTKALTKIIQQLVPAHWPPQ